MTLTTRLATFSLAILMFAPVLFNAFHFNGVFA